MPMVGKKKFAYTAKGKAMAKAEAKKSAKPMKSRARKRSSNAQAKSQKDFRERCACKRAAGCP
jgi:hypothetical protein